MQNNIFKTYNLRILLQKYYTMDTNVKKLGNKKIGVMVVATVEVEVLSLDKFQYFQQQTNSIVINNAVSLIRNIII